MIKAFFPLESPLLTSAPTKDPNSLDRNIVSRNNIAMTWDDGVVTDTDYDHESTIVPQEFWRIFHADGASYLNEWQYNPSELISPQATIYYPYPVAISTITYNLSYNTDFLPTRILLSNENEVLDDYEVGSNWGFITRSPKMSLGKQLKFQIWSRKSECVVFNNCTYKGIMEIEGTICKDLQSYEVANNN